MDDINRKLAAYKKQINEMTAPDDMGIRLENVLQRTPDRGSKKGSLFAKLAIVVAVMLVCLAGYNHNALAFYSKKALGYFDIYRGMGEMQDIDKTIVLEDGLYFTVNGIMTDPNQLLLFYTFSAPGGLDTFDTSKYQLTHISGFLTNAGAHGGGSYDMEGGTEQEGLLHFDAVNPFARHLTLTIWGEEGYQQITFPHDPNKAMKASIDTKMNETVQLDKGSITFTSITATPTMTLLKGRIDSKGNTFEALSGIQLLGNKQTMGRSGSQMTTEQGKPATFEIRFMALPEKVEDVGVFLREFIGFSTVGDTIDLNDGVIGKELDFHDQEVMIKDIKKKQDHTEVLIKTDSTTQLDGLSLITENGQINLKEITEEEYGMENKLVRTYIFETTQQPTALSVEGMYFMKPYGVKVDVPIN